MALARSKLLLLSSRLLRPQLFRLPELEAEPGSGQWVRGALRDRLPKGLVPLRSRNDESPERGLALGPRAPGCDCAGI